MGRAVTRGNLFANTFFLSCWLWGRYCWWVGFCGPGMGVIKFYKIKFSYQSNHSRDGQLCKWKCYFIHLSFLFLKIHTCVIWKHCIRQPDGMRSIPKWENLWPQWQIHRPQERPRRSLTRSHRDILTVARAHEKMDQSSRPALIVKQKGRCDQWWEWKCRGNDATSS